MEQLYFNPKIAKCPEDVIIFTANNGSGYVINNEVHISGAYHFVYKFNTPGWYIRNPVNMRDIFLGDGAIPTMAFDGVNVFNDYVYQKIIYDPESQGTNTGDIDDAEQMIASLNRANLMFVLAAQEGKVDNTTILQNADLFSDDWEPDKEYVVGDFRLDEGVLYKCIQAHHSQVGWNPSAVPALWVLIGDPNEEYPEWRQPRFREESYMYGQKCSHNEKKWHSTMDYNTFEPGALNSHWEEDTDLPME